jgi:hypothetical protein
MQPDSVATRLAVRKNAAEIAENLETRIRDTAQKIAEAFGADIASSQLNELERLALSADWFGDIEEWLMRQTGKDSKRKEKENWARPSVDQHKMIGQEAIALFSQVAERAEEMARRDPAVLANLHDLKLRAAGHVARYLNSAVMYEARSARQGK